MAVKGVCVILAVAPGGSSFINVELQYCSVDELFISKTVQLGELSAALSKNAMENAIKNFVKEQLILDGTIFTNGDTVRLFGAID